VPDAPGARDAIYVIYESRIVPDLSSFEEETLVRKELFRKKTLTLARLTEKSKDAGSRPQTIDPHDAHREQ
jgi:hypothetical protein